MKGKDPHNVRIQVDCPSRLEEFALSDWALKIEVPDCLEANQEGNLNITVTSAKDATDVVIVFTSPDIHCNSKGESAIRLEEIQTGVSINRQASCFRP